MRDFKKAALSFAKLLNVLLMMFSFAVIWRLSYDEAVRAETTVQIKALLLIITMILYVVLGRIYDAFLIGHERISDIVYSQTLTIVIVDVCSYFLQWLNTGNPPKLPHYLLILPIQLLFSVAWAYCSNRWYYRNFPPKRALIISKDDEATRRLLRIKSFSKKYIFEKSMTTDELLKNYSTALDNIDVVFLLNTQNAWAVMQICAFRGVTIYRVPLVSEVIASRSKTVTLFHTPMLRMDGYHPDASYLFLKRCMDIVISGIALLILSPVMLIVAAAIKLEDKGPVFYRQERLTRGGKRFYILKFRSMRTDAESDGVVRLSTGDNDDRITKVGRIIRKIRLDELPQAVNILMGDMSIVGPRPERPELTEEYSKVFPEFKLRLLSKAGLTGYAQVYGKYNTTPEDKLCMDLMYILRPNIFEDIRLILATVKILFVPESTEGVAEGQTNAMK